MKSIKEKAAEYIRVIKVINENESIVDTKGGDKFIEGANYVVEQIEKMIPSDDVLENHTKCKSAIFRLQAIIEQLKK